MKNSDESIAASARGSFSATARQAGFGETLKFSMSKPPTGRQVFSVVFLLCVTTLLGSVVVSVAGNVALMLFLVACTAVPLWLLVGVVLALFRGGKGFLGIYEGGFIHQRGAGDLIAVPWREVRAITRTATTMVVDGQERHTYVMTVLESERGKTTLNEEFPDVLVLSEILEGKISESLLPGALARLRAGQRLEFGPIVLDREGIRHGSDQLPLARVGQIYPYNGKLTITHQGTSKTWKRVPLRRLPNAGLFAHLVDLVRDKPV